MEYLYSELNQCFPTITTLNIESNFQSTSLKSIVIPHQEYTKANVLSTYGDFLGGGGGGGGGAGGQGMW